MKRWMTSRESSEMMEQCSVRPTLLVEEVAAGSWNYSNPDLA